MTADFNARRCHPDWDTSGYGRGKRNFSQEGAGHPNVDRKQVDVQYLPANDIETIVGDTVRVPSEVIEHVKKITQKH